MAIQDQNRQFSAVARFAEHIGLDHAEAKIPLIEFLEEPLYRRNLPDPEPLPTNYARFFTNSALARIRRADISATVYGGSDWPLGIASGLASNPTFFNFRKGKAVLESVRMMPTFFQRRRIQKRWHEGSRESLPAPPGAFTFRTTSRCPKICAIRRETIRLTPAGNRFWSKMDFPQRPKSNIQSLEQKVTVTENAGAFELAFDVGGHDRVPLTIELTFLRRWRIRRNRAGRNQTQSLLPAPGHRTFPRGK